MSEHVSLPPGAFQAFDRSIRSASDASPMYGSTKLDHANCGPCGSPGLGTWSLPGGSVRRADS